MYLKVVSWNVHRCIGTDGRHRPERIARVLSRLGADFVALQEVDSSLHTDGEIDQLTAIADAIGMRALIGPTLQRSYGVYGNVLLARKEAIAVETCDLSYRKFEPRGAIAAHFRFDFGILRLVNCHLGLKYWERTFQIDRLLRDFVWREGVFTCVAGDFNEWISFSPNSFRLRRTLAGGTRHRTFPSVWPRFALDRVFFNWPVRRHESHVVNDGEARVASDHLPVHASFEWDESDSLPRGFFRNDEGSPRARHP